MSFSEITADDFARRFAMRGAKIMWLLGAGASASAGIPTASDMIWDFKQQLYVTQRRVAPGTVRDLTNPAVRAQLQNFIDASGNYPAPGHVDEYAALFEAAYPNERDRRTYIDARISRGKPSYGHLALATLMRAKRLNLVWTTNFDALIADACARIYGSTKDLTTAALDAPDVGLEAMAQGQWPIEMKLHGDFRSRRLKNTSDELLTQDVKLRQSLVEAAKRFGLVIAGYSGRDDSIMDTLREAVRQGGSFPAGLFWLHRGEGDPPAAVPDLLTQAAAAGIDGGLVRVENFDEALRDLVRILPDLDTTELDKFGAERSIWSPSPKPAGKSSYPVLRLNAVPVVTSPVSCLRVDCDIGGHADITAAIAAAGVDILATRSRRGVLAFGTEGDIRRAFGPFNIRTIDLHSIEPRRLRYDSQERGLLKSALSRALARHHGLELLHRRSRDILYPRNPDDAKLKQLREVAGTLGGKLSAPANVSWREGVMLQLEWADERLWLVIDPRPIALNITEEGRAAAAAFIKEKTFNRYNERANGLISFWSTFLAASGASLRALNLTTGVDAVFVLSPENAFSGRLSP
ncbi:MAG: SIR2 family protein [Hyphomonadaceae bacterium]